MKQESLEMFLKCCLTTIQSRMSIGNEFQADGAETAKALSVNRRRVRGVMKWPLDFERSRLSVHGLHSSHKYNGAVPRQILSLLYFCWRKDISTTVQPIDAKFCMMASTLLSKICPRLICFFIHFHYQPNFEKRRMLYGALVVTLWTCYGAL